MNVYKNILRIKKLSAFTLAEVLITLGIIGIVAAMTVPSLIKNYQKQQTVVELQKVLSTISNAYTMSVSQNGPGDSWDLPSTWDAAGSTQFWNSYFVPYISVSRTCTSANYSQCWSSASTFLDGKPLTVGIYFLMLNDGTLINLSGGGSGYGVMYVDINGFKKPNIMGKDIFKIDYYFTTGKVSLDGQGLSRSGILSPGDYSCSLDSGIAKGNWCGALIQIDGWKISDDYPW